MFIPFPVWYFWRLWCKSRCPIGYVGVLNWSRVIDGHGEGGSGAVRGSPLRPHRSVGKGDLEAEFGEFSGKTSGEAGALCALEVIGAEIGIKDAASEHPLDGGEDGGGDGDDGLARAASCREPPRRRRAIFPAITLAKVFFVIASCRCYEGCSSGLVRSGCGLRHSQL
jgi:hypothetical protein